MKNAIDFLKEEKKYNEKEVVNLVNYMTSNFRKRFFSFKETPPEVWDNDISNWKDLTHNGRKEIDFQKLKDALN